jgi:hypothetical protein
MSPRPLVVVTCCLAILGKTGLAQAIEWVAEPSIRTGLEYNDNYFLSTAPHKAVKGANLGANLDLAAQQEQWELRGSAHLLSRRYGGREDLNTDDGTSDLNYSFKNDRNLWQLKIFYANESTLIYDKINPDIGITEKQTKRATTSASPTWAWQVAETTQLRLDYQFARVKYKDGVSAGLLDYDQQATSLTLSDQVLPRTNIYIALNYSDYQVMTPKAVIPTSYTAVSKTNTGQIGITHDFTETLKGSLSGGPRKTMSGDVAIKCGYTIFGIVCTPPVTQSNTGYGSVFSGSLESHLQLTNTTLRFSRTVSASGSGSEVQADNLTLGIQRQITPERLSVQLTAEVYAIKALGLTTNAVDRNYYRLEPGLRWRWTEDLAVEASYRNVRQRFVNAPDVATSNSVYLTFTYIWPRLSVSR